MATIQKNSNGTFRIRVYLGKDADGKQLFKSFTYPPKGQSFKESTPAKMLKEVKAYADEKEKQIQTGAYLTGEEITFNEFFDYWKINLAEKHLTPTSIEYFCMIIGKEFAPVIGNKTLSTISGLQLQAIENSMEKRISPITIRKYFSCLSSLFTQAMKLHIIHENPVRTVSYPKTDIDPADIHFFDIPHAKAFLRALDDGFIIHHPETKTKRKNSKEYTLPAYTETITVSKQFRAYFYLAIFSGCRRGELIALTWNDIDTNKGLLSISKATASTKKDGQYIKGPKTKAGKRTLALPVICFEVLDAWKAEQIELCRAHGTRWQGKSLKDFDNNFIFTQDNGQQMHLSTPTHKFRELIDYYNMSVTDEADKLPIIKLHDLRHTSASLLIASGYVDIETIARRLGHSDISMTLNRYGHALPSQDAKAVQALENMLNMHEEPTAIQNVPADEPAQPRTTYMPA